MSGPLEGILVLDLSRILAGPWATQILADMGATVVKVERPGTGDDTRHWGPPFVDGKGDAAYFHSTNRGKKSVAIDISSEDGQGLIAKLAANADVLIENYKVGGLANYGLDYQILSAANPGLIYCSITGFGQTGPYADRGGYDYLVQGMAGMMSITGEAEGKPGSGPRKVGVAIADIVTGLYATTAILGALHHRDRTGEGQHIDLALMDSMLAALANQNMNYLVGGTAPERMGNAHPNLVPYQVFSTADGHMILAIGNDAQFARFCSLAGREDLAGDERFRTNPGRVTNRDALIPMLEEIITARPTEDWMISCEAEGIPCGPINSIEQAFADPQVQHRGLRLDLDRGDGTTVPSVANPIRYGATPMQYKNPSPRLGEHTRDVLSDLGLGEAEIDDLFDRKIVG